MTVLPTTSRWLLQVLHLHVGMHEEHADVGLDEGNVLRQGLDRRVRAVDVLQVIENVLRAEENEADDEQHPSDEQRSEEQGESARALRILVPQRDDAPDGEGDADEADADEVPRYVVPHRRRPEPALVLVVAAFQRDAAVRALGIVAVVVRVHVAAGVSGVAFGWFEEFLGQTGVVDERRQLLLDPLHVVREVVERFAPRNYSRHVGVAVDGVDVVAEAREV
eukprot:CAMPEP_0198111562 /NCGR_PEP_ID=MMETSP1442-20131203/3523_1 /TAXON_ID= /ORGANISM="Craspedostauros australis, Strain CCMP3328" /LENGTH=221 /DNA_ID=CAMNT_0043768057 /DNA_START=1347 /DNA_END=2008 /DNA_ORIENTATION=-